MDKKIYAVIAVVIIIVAAAAAVVLTRDGGDGPTASDRDVSVVGRVNTDGSGIFLKSSENPEDYVTLVEGAEPVDEEYYLGGGDRWVVLHKEAWGGAVFGDPGEATIQHVQLGQIAEELGLKFVKYTNGTAIDKNTLYYIPGVNTYQMFESQLINNPQMVGAFVWEAQYSVALQDGCKRLAITNDLFPGHTCCIVGAQHSYISTHQDETVRFLAAYVESVREMKDAIANHVTGEMDELMEIAINNVTMPLTMTQEQKIAAIESAFEIVNYTYADSDTAANPLDKLTSDMASLAEDFYQSGQISKTPQQLGFDSYSDMASVLVQGQYMYDALHYEKQDSYDTANITVAVLTGDIHQLAIHYGMAKNIFADYGINIILSNQSAGPAAFTAMANGSAQFAFLGAPPMTTNTINGGYISP